MASTVRWPHSLPGVEPSGSDSDELSAAGSGRVWGTCVFFCKRTTAHPQPHKPRRKPYAIENWETQRCDADLSGPGVCWASSLSLRTLSQRRASSW